MAKENGVSQKWSELGISTEPKEDTQVTKQEYLHNWLYSVVPARPQITTWDTEGNTTHPAVGIYLAGYCRNCRRAFSAPIPHDWTYLETQLEVPNFGCSAPPKG